MHKGFVLLNCDLGAEEFILEELKKIPNVSQAYITTKIAFQVYKTVSLLQEQLARNQHFNMLTCRGASQGVRPRRHG